MTTATNSSQAQQGLHVDRLGANSINLLAAMMHLKSSGELYVALQLIAQGDNIRRLGYALARVFYYQECLPVEELKIKGYVQLRQIVTDIVAGLRNIDAQIASHPDYKKVISTLFTSHGIQAP